MKKGIRKETERLGAFIVFGVLGMDASGYADEPWQFQCACTMIFHLKIRADDHDFLI